jgi:hypothetical protein
MSKFSKYAAALSPSVCENPLPFISKVEKVDKVDGTEETSLSGSSCSFSWIQTTQPPSTPDILISSRIDTSFRGLDQGADGLL